MILYVIVNEPNQCVVDLSLLDDSSFLDASYTTYSEAVKALAWARENLLLEEFKHAYKVYAVRSMLSLCSYENCCRYPHEENRDCLPRCQEKPKGEQCGREAGHSKHCCWLRGD